MSTESTTLMINDIMNQFRIRFQRDIEPGESDEKVFEKLVAYLMTCKHALDYDFDIQDIHSGQNEKTSGSERSIDSAAVIINGIVIPGVEYLEENYKEFKRSMKISYVFTQSKRTGSFSNVLGNHSKFVSGVCSILESKEPPEGVTPSLSNFAKIKNVIESGKIIINGNSRGLPLGNKIDVYTYYAMPVSERSKDSGLHGAKTQIAQNIRNLEKTGVYSVHDTAFVGSETIRSIYEDVFIGSTAEFNMSTLKAFDASNISMHGICKIFTGHLPLSEFKKIIHDESGNLKGGIFNENVRDYLKGANINKSVKESLRNGRSKGEKKTEEDRRVGRDLFFAMNNGVTIITKDLDGSEGTGNLMRIQGYQIVNGCQTSNILHEYYTELTNTLKNLQKKVPDEYLDNNEMNIMRIIAKNVSLRGGDITVEQAEEQMEKLISDIETLNDQKKLIEDVESSICVPIRIIHTQNDDVIDMIIESTNNQNPVNKLVLSSRSPFNKDLEYYFKNINQGVLVYERRKNQYINSSESFENKIGIVELMKSFASIYLKRPHDSARYSGKLSNLATRSSKPLIFSENHNCESYYLAARIYFDLEGWLRRQKLLKEYQRNRWHLMYGVSRILQRDFYSKKNLSIVSNNIQDRSCRKNMIKILDAYFKEYQRTGFEDIFCKAKEVVDEAISEIHDMGTELNEINKSPDFANQIDVILAR